MLTGFFRINMPYGMKKVDKNRWIVFNREYCPLGSCTEKNKNNFDDSLKVEYENLTPKRIVKLIEKLNIPEHQIKRDYIDNSICAIFLYNDGTNPANQCCSLPNNEKKLYKEYFRKLEILCNLKTK